MKRGRVYGRNDDPNLKIYLEDIGKTPLISKEEEVELTKKIKAGDERAFEKLVKANLRFVVSVAKQYQNQGMLLIDLINEGNIGLIKATRRFDETRGFKFISYAVWWIRQAILMALAEQSRIVRLPLNRVGTLHKIGKITQRLTQYHERHPSVFEIADELNLSEQEVSGTIRIHSEHLSLHQPVDGDEDHLLIDTLEDELQQDELQPKPDESLLSESLKLDIKRALNSLLKREAEVLLLYFGLNGETPMTLDEIGQNFNLTRERIRQIKEKAFKRLRKTACGKALRQYLA